jgi:hypothetical protein
MSYGGISNPQHKLMDDENLTTVSIYINYKVKFSLFRDESPPPIRTRIDPILRRKTVIIPVQEVVSEEVLPSRTKEIQEIQIRSKSREKELHIERGEIKEKLSRDEPTINPKSIRINIISTKNQKGRILITGARDWSDIKMVTAALKEYNPKQYILVHGTCKGADSIAGDAAQRLGFEVEEHPANWKLGKRAGPIRNKEMLDTKPDIILVFHDNLNESKGTKNCVIQAEKMGFKDRLRYFSH